MRAKTYRRVLSALGAGVLTLAPAAVALASEGGPTETQMSDFLLRCLNFAALLVILFVVVRKPLKSALQARAEGIEQELDELKQKRDDAAKELADMEKRLQQVQQERDSVLEDFRVQGERERERIIDGATALAERIKAQAQFTIEQETSQAKAELKREIAEMSAAVAEDLLKDNITPEDQTRLVNEYLTKVEQEVQ